MRSKLIVAMLVGLFATVAVKGVPAWPGSWKATQKDGTTVTLRLVGDEYQSFITTDDGYTVVQNAGGSYVYATLDDDGQLQPTPVVAHDVGARSAEELDLTARLVRGLHPAMSREASERKASIAQ